MGQISEVQFSAEPETLMALSRLFTYPEQLPDSWDLARIFTQARQIPACPSLTGLQNRYVSLFINHLPEVPCIPCGSWYLEGTLMGPSTVKLANLIGNTGLKHPRFRITSAWNWNFWPSCPPWFEALLIPGTPPAPV
jgi:hypothetical protein